MTSFDEKWSAKSFCDKMKPCTPMNKVGFYAKTRFIPTFPPFFDNISEVFQPILLLKVALGSGHSKEQFLFVKKSLYLVF